MPVSYNRLWLVLNTKQMSIADLRKSSGIAPHTMTKHRKNHEVSLTVLGKVCESLRVDYGDIIEYIPAAPHSKGKGEDK